ncbi:hypothetical protein D3C87_1496330 [compost metagenome]
MGAAQLLVAIVLFRRRDAGTLFLGAAVSVLAFFMLAPRMHERYGVAGLGLLTVACALNPRLKRIYWVLCAVALLNLHFAMNTQFGDLLRAMDLYKALCVANLLAFGGLVRALVRNARKDDSSEIYADGSGALVGERHALLEERLNG